MDRKLAKYLRSRAILTPWRLSGCERDDFNSAIVIPALAEAASLPETLAALSGNPAESLSQTLIVVVVNNRCDACPAQQRDNQQTLRWLQTDPFLQLNLAWIDASSSGRELPGQEGVGLARKLGFDAALQRLDWSRRPLLISLDADTLVDAHYLPAIMQHFAQSETGGATLPFYHQAGETPEQDVAIRRYELYLRSYLFGLHQSGSPYAYHAIGSAFACRAAAYVAAGGMNRRQAAEDFYFLQQLAKTSGVEQLSGTLVRPSPRFSERVPFGTGRAVQAQLAGAPAGFRFCPAEAFAVLQRWLQLIRAGWQQPAAELKKEATLISPPLGDFLAQLDFAGQWEKLQRNHAGRAQRIAAFHAWFDGLRTRQLLSLWSREMLPEEELQLVAELLTWGKVEPDGADLGALLKALEAQPS